MEKCHRCETNLRILLGGENKNFMFEWQEQYFTRSLRSLVRYCFLPREHKTHIFELTCYVLFII